MTTTNLSHATLVRNAYIFDRVHEALVRSASALIESSPIKKILTSAIDAPDATLVDANGRVMTQGFIDCHAHALYQCAVRAASQHIADFENVSWRTVDRRQSR